MKDKRVKDAFKSKFNSEFRFFAAPGRINIIGEHTDYNDGFVLPAAIDKRIYLAIAPSKGPDAEIIAHDFTQKVSFNIHEPAGKIPHWAKYPYGVVKELQAAGYFIEGFKAVFGGDIPRGAGLSSSAALESAFATALNAMYKLGIGPMELAMIGQRAEHNYAGVKCGIMDQFASLHGSKDHVMKLDCRSLEFEYFPLELQGYELILADTGVKHSLASSEYNVRRAQCEEGVSIMQKQMPGIKSLRDVTPKDVASSKNEMSPEVFMRCEYVTEENERVTEACIALEKGDMKEVGRLLYQSHDGLSNKYQVSCPELDLLIDTAKQINGVMGGRMMGGGFGGCTINLVESAVADTFKSTLSKSFLEKFGKEPVFHAVNISDGAREEV